MSTILLVYGVPQGSILGPVLFTLHSQLLSSVISDQSCEFHTFAGDTELSQSAAPDEISFCSMGHSDLH